MDYVKEIDKLIEAGLDNVKKSSELRQLMYRIYGDLFLESGTPASCGSKDSMYFTKVCVEGKKKAQKYDSVKNRTLIFRSNGKIYLPKAGVTFNFNLIDDEKAIDMLNKGWIAVGAFRKMPDGYHLDASIGKWVKDESSDDELQELVNCCKAAHKAEENKAEELCSYKPTANERMKQLFAEGKEAKEIASILNSEGYKTPKGKDWTSQGVGGAKRYL